MSVFTNEDKHQWKKNNEEGTLLECALCSMEIKYPGWEWDEEINNVCRAALKKTGNWRKNKEK